MKHVLFILLTLGTVLFAVQFADADVIPDVMNHSYVNQGGEISPGGIGTVGTMRFIQQQNLGYGRGSYASQSSLAWGGNPDRAVDGNTDGEYNNNSVIHTAGGAYDWWQVQFADSDVPVNKVIVWNRLGFEARLSNITLSLYSSDPTTGASPLYTYNYTDGALPISTVFDLPENLDASWIRITNGSTEAINIAEVQVYSSSDNGGFSPPSNNGEIIDDKQYQSYNLTLSGDSTLTMDINSTNADVLSVSGVLSMSGTLKLNVQDASNLTTDFLKDIIQANSFAGKFNNIVVEGADAEAFNNLFDIFQSENENISFIPVGGMVYWLETPQDNNFSNVNNWSANPVNQEVYVGKFASGASNIELSDSFDLSVLHLGYSDVPASETSVTLNNGANLTNARSIYIGEKSNASLTVKDGATLTNGGNIYIGLSDQAQSEFNVNGGTVSNSGDLYVGYEAGAQGTLNVTGGTVTTNTLQPGFNSNSIGIVNISGGEVNVNAESAIGNFGSGRITVSGDGKLNFANSARIANNGGAPSFINIEGNGEVTAKHLFVGQAGANQGSVTMSGNSKLTVTDLLEIGTNTGGSGTMTLKDNAIVHVTAAGNNRVRIGYSSGTNSLNVSDNASFTVDGYSIVIGDSATGVINQTGGTITLSPNATIYTGDQGSGRANINISGGEFNTNAQFVAGTRGITTINLSGTGVFNANKQFVGAPGYAITSSSFINQTGGTFNANEGIEFGLNANQGTGIYNLSDGTLNATTITRKAESTNLNAQLYISGGNANIGTLAIPSHMTGGTLNAGTIDTSITTTDAFQQSGGVLTIGGTGTVGTTTITGSYLAATQLNNATNIALTGTAFKESGYGGDQFPAYLGNDGNYGNFAHTAEDGQLHIPYWGVSYSEDVNFGKVAIWNRPGWGNNRLFDEAGFYVDVLDGENGEGNVVWRSQTYTGGGYDGFVVDVPYDVVGKSIRVIRAAATATPLNLAEVEVYAYSSAVDASNLPTLKFEILSADEYDQLVLLGDSFDVGSALAALDVSALDSSALSGLTGTTFFELISLPDSVDITGEFASITLPEIGDGYEWDLSALYTDGVIALIASETTPGVPEPSTWALMILGAAGLLYWRKRKNA